MQEKIKDDTISRQAAIDALHMHLMYRMGTDSNKKRLDEWINNLPSVQPEIKADENNHYKTGYNQGFVDACKMYEKKQPEIKTGRWIHKHERTPKTWECSNCGYRVNLMDGGIYHFCSACGERKDGEG